MDLVMLAIFFRHYCQCQVCVMTLIGCLYGVDVLVQQTRCIIFGYYLITLFQIIFYIYCNPICQEMLFFNYVVCIASYP